MTLPVQTNLNTSIGSTRLVTFTEHTVNTYIFPLLLPNRGKIHVFTLTSINDSTPAMPSSPIHYKIREEWDYRGKRLNEFSRGSVVKAGKCMY
jgi:hypothetical protein